MKLLYFLPIPVGIGFILWMHYKCCHHYYSRLKSKEISEAEFDDKIQKLAGYALALYSIWTFTSFIVAVVCIFAD